MEFINALVVKSVDTKHLKPQGLINSIVSVSLKTLSILNFLFIDAINIRNQGKLICAN